MLVLIAVVPWVPPNDALLQENGPIGLRFGTPGCSGRAAGRAVSTCCRAPGRLDAASGTVHAAELKDPDDLLDDLAGQVLRTGGEVVVAPAERMPSTTGLAAIYRH
ncbi:MAG: hypothetical protein EHM83_02175 [Burkholderiales bacterium]|nr:MAG: hypothetical protein EHM83_02175 [Burkholderiales bacterium]